MAISDTVVIVQFIFTRESSYSFQHILAIAVLSVHLSITRVDQSKMVQSRITKSSPLAAWKTSFRLPKLFRKFSEVYPKQRY